MDSALLGTLLQLSAGITKVLRFPGGEMAFRAAACTGALYHVDLYLVCGDLPDLPAGVYHFDVERVALTPLRVGDFRGVLVEATAGDEAVCQAPVTVAATSTWWRNSWKYQARTYRHAFWDSGTLLANLLAVASAHGLPAAVTLGFVDAAVNRLLGVDPAHEAALALVPVGAGAPATPPAPEVAPLNLPIEPYSFHEVDEPLIREAHQATSLSDAAQVAAWHKPVPSSGWSPADVAAVIRRRGSARAFERTPISLETLQAVLRAGDATLANDWGGPLAEPSLIVNDVAGLNPGAYGPGLAPLRLGDYRQVAAHLDLGQDLAGDAAVNVYWLADLEAVLARLGERGYRAAQLDAALAAGRMYLAAYAGGIAATGLTFFDDEVSDFFDTSKSVMFLLALGNRRKRTTA
jgi:SagB-type dehydrogenase family enzyme